MVYKQFNKHGNTITPEDLQNKILWCKEGERIEEVFVSKYGDKLGLVINPDKKSNPYAPDLLKSTGGLGDLKTQNTPFFKVKKLYGLNPSYTVVFNRKDYERYRSIYPGIEIFFWVEWHSVKFQMGGFIQEFDYINGVWSIPFASLCEVIERSQEHFYKQRISDRNGNARSSFVINLLDSAFKKVI